VLRELNCRSCLLYHVTKTMSSRIWHGVESASDYMSLVYVMVSRIINTMLHYYTAGNFVKMQKS